MQSFVRLLIFGFLLSVTVASGAAPVKDGYGEILQFRAISGGSGSGKVTLIQVKEGSELEHGSCSQENWDFGNQVVWAIDGADNHIVSVALAAFMAGKKVRVLGDTILTVGSYCRVAHVTVAP